jgi:hypothetical protein
MVKNVKMDGWVGSVSDKSPKSRAQGKEERREGRKRRMGRGRAVKRGREFREITQGTV